MLLNRVCQDILLLIYTFYLKEVEDFELMKFVANLTFFGIMLITDIALEIMKKNTKITYIYYLIEIIVTQVLVSESQVNMQNEHLYLAFTLTTLLQNTLFGIFINIDNQSKFIHPVFLGLYLYVYIRIIVVQHYLNYIIIVLLGVIFLLTLWSIVTITVLTRLTKQVKQQKKQLASTLNEQNQQQDKEPSRNEIKQVFSPIQDKQDKQVILHDFSNKDYNNILELNPGNHDYAQIAESQKNFDQLNICSSYNSINDKRSKNETPQKHFNLFNFIPDGIAFISPVSLTFQFTNDSFKDLLNIRGHSSYLDKIRALKNIELVELQKFQEQCPNLEESLQSSTFYQEVSPFLSAFAKNSKRQNDPLFKTNSLKSENREVKHSPNEPPDLMKSSVDHVYSQPNIILQQLFKIQQFHSTEKFRKHLKSQRLKSQLIAVYLAYSFDSIQPTTKKQVEKRLIEISIFCVLLDDDITIIMQARDVSYKDYIKKQKELSKEKSNIISFVSHEYRSTLNSIINLLYAVIDDQSDPGLNLQYSQIAYNNAQFLLNLSNDLLDLAQIKVGKFSIIPKHFNLNQLLEECIAMFQLQADAKNILLKQDLDQYCQSIFSDPNRVKQVVINLLGNAFKFTSQGSITVRSCVQGDGLIKVEVEDTGVGIKAEDQPKLFKAFGKINNDENKKLNSQGVGLGLLISDKIAKNLNKDQNAGLQFSSKFLKGTKFWFLIFSQRQLITNQMVSVIKEVDEDSLKCQDEYDTKDYRNFNPPFFQTFLSNKSTILGKSNKLSQDVDCQCPKIMVVDDTPFNIVTFKAILNKIKKVSIKEIYSGQDAEKFMVESVLNGCESKSCQCCRLIFMDIEMPIQDGFVTARNILEITRKSELRPIIVACSGYCEQKLKDKAYEMGMREFLEKPIDTKSLSVVIEKYL